MVGPSIYKCAVRGLSEFHGDIDTGLSEYADGSFDYVIQKQISPNLLATIGIYLIIKEDS